VAKAYRGLEELGDGPGGPLLKVGGSTIKIGGRGQGKTERCHARDATAMSLRQTGERGGSRHLERGEGHSLSRGRQGLV